MDTPGDLRAASINGREVDLPELAPGVTRTLSFHDANLPAPDIDLDLTL